jgi:ankyrin repeat protein
MQRRDCLGVLSVLLGGAMSAGAFRVAAATPAQEQAARLADAIAKNSPSDVRRLLMLGASPNAAPQGGEPPLIAAVRARRWQAMGALLESRELDLECTTAQGETALMLVAMSGAIEPVIALIEHGAQINRPGWTPLHYAAVGGSKEIVLRLLEESAYIDAASPNGTTPLMMAARHEKPDIVRLLVEEGADPSLRNERGWSAADYLEQRGDAKTAAWMRERAREFVVRYNNPSQNNTQPQTSAPAKP